VEGRATGALGLGLHVLLGVPPTDTPAIRVAVEESRPPRCFPGGYRSGVYANASGT